MTWIKKSDGRNFVCMSEGYFPADTKYLEKRTEDLARKYDRIRRFVEVPAPTASEYANLIAWLANAWTRAITAKWGYSPAELPLETWVIGPPLAQDSAFADWFSEQRDGQSYRVLLHRHPELHRGFAQGINVWGNFYNRFPVRHRKGSSAGLKEKVAHHVQILCDAYFREPTTVEQVVRSFGHEYGSCRDPPLR